MDWENSLGWILTAAFGIGALHALEPGHGKSIMGAYLVASHGGIRHAFLLGLVVTLTHTAIVYLLALAALLAANRFATEAVTFWLELGSAALVLAVGVWMLLTSFGVVRRGRREAAHPHGAHEPHGAHGHTHGRGGDADHHHEHGEGEGHGHTHEIHIPRDANPLGFWTLMGGGPSGGLAACAAAWAALRAAVRGV